MMYLFVFQFVEMALNEVKNVMTKTKLMEMDVAQFVQ